MAVVNSVGADAAPKTIVSESIPDTFPVGSVYHSEDLITFTVD